MKSGTDCHNAAGALLQHSAGGRSLPNPLCPPYLETLATLPNLREKRHLSLLLAPGGIAIRLVGWLVGWFVRSLTWHHESSSPTFMKFGTDVQHRRRVSLVTFQRC